MVLVFLLMACSAPSNSSSTSDTGGASPSASPASESTQDGNETTSVPGSESTSPLTQLPQLQGDATVVLQVNGKTITLAISGKDAPITAGNFIDLVDQKVYDGTAFHRVVRTPSPFVVQGGDPQSKDPNFPVQQLGTGSYLDPETKQARYLPLEILPEGAEQAVYSKTLKSAGENKPPKLRHTRGAVAMARSQLPDSASAQFYFALADVDFLDGNYAVFGYVTEGMEVVDQIQQGDRIESAKVTAGIENLKR
ncbi:peptidylprolyl isomerase [Acaryochloris sp. 'Moss Beach']|uniref:peptidylprolyl isomerase n=1 Tax=Acaryochloris sp. 'Moss Beach' TaxID=2740837 RepID=UPI001F3D903E|nr:peptidylprolyl isomerase [Acaryochloris sp. 'Moss Beach']UJB70184.1 peptidylprolyl isomerase [Acaryochloris sp. 'Moss Beach']